VSLKDAAFSDDVGATRQDDGDIHGVFDPSACLHPSLQKRNGGSQLCESRQLTEACESMFSCSNRTFWQEYSELDFTSEKPTVSTMNSLFPKASAYALAGAVLSGSEFSWIHHSKLGRCGCSTLSTRLADVGPACLLGVEVLT